MTPPLSEEAEAALLERVRQGDAAARREACGAVFVAFRERVFALALHVTGNREDAEEALQETFLAVLRGLSGFRGESRLGTWIYRIALRAALRACARSARRGEPLLSEPPAPVGPDPLGAAEEQARLRMALAGLSVEHRMVVSLFAVEGLPHAQIAAILGVPEGTVWSRLHAARKQLAAALARPSSDVASRT